MQWFSNKRIVPRLFTGILLATLVAWGSGYTVCRAESGVDRRIEEFKAGMHKDAAVATHDEEKKPSAGHAPAIEEKAAAHSTAKKHKPAVHKKSEHKAAATHSSAGHGGHAEAMDADEALKQLLEGNRRYASGHAKGPNRTAARRTELAGGQKPIAVIVSCSDSRVPPELLFDQGFGDLFVIRIAGNIVDANALGSIEYSVDHLGTKLIVVLGHERCGAVTAALQGGNAPGNIKNIVDGIAPAIEKGKARYSGHGELLDSCILANVKQVAQKIRTTAPILSEKVEDGMLKVVGAYYDLDSGAVNMTYMPN